MSVHFPGPDSYCMHCGAKPLRLRQGQAHRRRSSECPQAAQQPPAPPVIQLKWPKALETLPAAAQEREAGGNAASPQLKIEGRVLLCFWQRNRSGISPPTSPSVGPTSMEGNMLQNHSGSKLAMRTGMLLKMPEESSFAWEAMHWVTEGHA